MTRLPPTSPPSGPAPASGQALPSDDHLRERWVKGARVHHRVYGVGVVVGVEQSSPSTDTHHWPHASAVVDFPMRGALARPLSAFTPVLSFEALLAAARVPPAFAEKLRADPALKPDVPVNGLLGIGAPHFTYRWVAWAAARVASMPRGEAGADAFVESDPLRGPGR